ncbi:hypothetical protein CBL_12790 [Carabus blaptoides fortunei]
MANQDKVRVGMKRPISRVDWNEEFARSMSPLKKAKKEKQVDTDVPSFAYKHLHMYRRISDITDLKPVNHVFVYDHVRLVGTYHYDYINRGSKYKSNFLKDRFTNDKILVSLDRVHKSPILDTAITLLGEIDYKRIYRANTIKLVPYILINFWSIVVDPDIERKLHTAATTIPAAIYKQTQHYIQNRFLNPANCGLSDNGGGLVHLSRIPVATCVTCVARVPDLVARLADDVPDPQVHYRHSRYPRLALEHHRA